MKILALPHTHFLSHLSRPLMLARELRRRGHEVVFAGGSPKTRFIQDEGFEVVPILEPRPDTLFANLEKSKIMFISEDEVGRMIEADLAAYRKLKPDLVLTDCRLSAAISTRIAGLRHAAITHVFCTEYRAVASVPLFEWLPRCLVSRDTGLWKALDRLNVGLETSLYNAGMGCHRRLSRKHGISPPVTAAGCFAGKDLTLLADVPEYFPTYGLPGSFHYIGPLTWKTDMPPPPWWPSLLRSRRRHLAFVMMSTTGTPDILRRAVRLLGDASITVVMTTGGQTADFQTIEGRLYAEPFLDADLVLRECDVVVTHGGHGAAYQALGHGKPIIGIPRTPGLRFNMRRVEALGVGRTLSWKSFSRDPGSLLAAVSSVVGDPAFAMRARKFKEILDTCDAVRLGADLIERLYRGDSP